ncbi:hypothetical protein QJS10_CPA09g00187 [Acorus calamus]|uniref:Uncharacterized protein n=1 Tax=Acorus calamus TaxID=4465 RepID=A0AAV9E7V9_ACOCL|nr:hypothetical protein QJS10_CPA09g00187 [Acorus calamus]
MERREPSLVPEWLKGPNNNSNSSNGGGGLSNSNHHFPSSSHSDEILSTPRYRNSGRDQNGSSFAHRRGLRANGSSSEKDGSRAYSSFSRSRAHRDGDRERDLDRRDRERPSRLEVLDYDVATLRGEKDTLGRSQSMVFSGRLRNGEMMPRGAVDSGSNGLKGGVVHKGLSERDFPSLGADEKQVGSEISRVASPRLAANLPMGIGGEGWTSALANLPGVIGGNNGSTQPPAPSTPTGLNMAETLSQAPFRARTASQVPSETQRLEELAIKQSRQLIPMTPSMPKFSVSSSNKLKPKSARNVDVSAAAKHVQQSQLGGHNLRLPVRSDVAKTSQGGRLLVLSREKNASIPATKDAQTIANGHVNNTLGSAPSTQFASLRIQNNPATPASALSMVQNSTVLDRKAIKDGFFDSLRKQNPTNHSPTASDTIPVVTSSISEKTDGNVTMVDAPAAIQDKVGDSSAVISGNSSSIENGDGEKIPCPDPKEEAFLKLLGWDENEQIEFLTPEEIAEYHREKQKSQASRGVGASGSSSSD